MLLALISHIVMVIVMALMTLIASADEAGTHDSVASTEALKKFVSILIYVACFGLSTPVLLATAFGFSSYGKALHEFFSPLFVLILFMVCFNLLLVIVSSITIVLLIPLPLGFCNAPRPYLLLPPEAHTAVVLRRL